MDLLQRFALGDVDAFETLVREFQGDVYYWIVRIVRDPGIAEDLTVETFWRVYRARTRFKPDGSFAAWSRRIATNLAIDHVKRRQPEQSMLAEPVSPPPPDPLLQREMRDAIRHAFRRLPAKLQVAATLALIEEQPYDQIAEALGTSVGAVKLRVFRAVRVLRKHLRRFRSEDLIART